MDTVEQLTQTFCDNFVAYTRSHIAHLNVVGRNFYSDHKLLNKIYDDLQDEIDFLGELIRAQNAFVPTSLREIAETSHISVDSIEGDADELLTEVKDDLLHLKECYVELLQVSEAEDLEEIANHAQDRLLALEKFIWMLSATLD
jgi:DNA-binding ferritin-like protein